MGKKYGAFIGPQEEMFQQGQLELLVSDAAQFCSDENEQMNVTIIIKRYKASLHDPERYGFWMAGWILETKGQ